MRYVVEAFTFRNHLKTVHQMGYRGCTVTDALYGDNKLVAITVDDGNASDIEVTAPMLCELGFQATFYVVSSWIDTARHLSSQGLRRLAELGLEIGSHSRTHSYIPGMSLSEIRREIVESKDFLEDAAGVPVRHFSCPLGGYSRRVLDVAMEAGYSTVATSYIGLNKPGGAILNRIAVYRETKTSNFVDVLNRGVPVGPYLRQALVAPLKLFPRFRGYSK